MAAKAAEKKPSTGGKAPAGKAPTEKKEAGKKTAAPTGDKKKRSKTRKETYSSYIYKGMYFLGRIILLARQVLFAVKSHLRYLLTRVCLCSSETSSP